MKAIIIEALFIITLGILVGMSFVKVHNRSQIQTLEVR